MRLVTCGSCTRCWTEYTEAHKGECPYCLSAYVKITECSIPIVLKQFLESLPKEQKDIVWEWLDGNSDAVYEMIAIVGEP